MTHLDLFSGIGGFKLAVDWAWPDSKCVGFVEIDKFCQKVLHKHWPDVPIHDDVCTYKYSGEVDLITGGFPCQDISIAGKGEGIEGNRSGLWSEFKRIISEVRPKFALIENVPALTFRGLDTVLYDLAEIGYDAEWQSISAAEVGAWHKRERIWIVAYPTGSRFSSRSDLQQIRDAEESEQTRDRRKYQVGEICDNISNPKSKSSNVGDNKSKREIPKSGNSSCEAPNTTKKGLEGEITESKFSGGQQRLSAKCDWWKSEPDVGRVAHGIPNTLHETIRDYGYANDSDQEAFTKIDSLRGEILRELWDENQEIKSTSLQKSRESGDDFVYEMSCLRTHEKWKLGQWIKKESNLRNMWGTILAKGFSQTQDLQYKLLERIREIERNEKVASSRVDRLKGLGNAIVPQCAFIILNQIKQIMDKENEVY